MGRPRFFVLTFFFLMFGCGEGTPAKTTTTVASPPVAEVAEPGVKLQLPADVDDPNAELVVEPQTKPTTVELWNGR